MKFRAGSREEPEINLIPFIDVLLVVLIFLMLSTTYSKFSELQLKLPVADVDAQRDYPKEVLASAIVAATKAGKDTVVIINADASAKHQSVITVMEAARRAGLTQITFATQPAARTAKP